MRGNKLYSVADGYGWTSPVPEFQRTTTSKASDALYRDGHWGSAVRTFQVAKSPSLLYDVRVYIGDASFGRDQIQVSVDGGANWTTAEATAVNAFTTVLISSIPAGGTVLDIMIRDNGGDPYWVVNGIEIWNSAVSDPSELTLLAGGGSSGMAGAWLTEDSLHAVLPLAREYWVSTGLAEWQVAELYRTPVAIADLSYRGALGVAKPEGIWLDASGAGLGWHTSLLTSNSQFPASSYDLLTVVTHELGHVLGYGDLDSHDHSAHIMAGVLQPGTRRIAMPYETLVPIDPRFAAGRTTTESSPGGVWELTGTSTGDRELLKTDHFHRNHSAAVGTSGLVNAAVDRVLDALLQDDLRVSKEGWSGGQKDELDDLLRPHRDGSHQDLDDCFARW